MSNTILFGGSGFFGPIILKKDPNIISVGRSAPSLDVSNKHVFIKNLDDLSILNKLEFEKVIFLIGSSNHHEINKSATMGIDFNVYPLKKILSFLKNKNIKKFICFWSREERMLGWIKELSIYLILSIVSFPIILKQIASNSK